jgi:hypothetical protein
VPRKVFVAGEILTAADVNTNLMDQAVQRFADSSTRGSAIPSPTEGMTSYLDDLNRIEVYDGSAWGAVGTILQVVSAVKTDTFSTTSTSYVDVTGLSATITPSSASSKILITAFVNLGNSANDGNFAHIRLTGGNSTTFVGDAASNRSRVMAGFGERLQGFYNTDYDISGRTGVFLDSPATTSATTYKVQGKIGDIGTLFVNRTGIDTDSARYPRGASSIVLMEVAG